MKLEAMFVLLAALSASTLVAAEKQIGIYFRPSRVVNECCVGYEGLKLALDAAGYENCVKYVDSLDEAALKDIGVLILPSVHGFPKEWNEDDIRAGLRKFVENGGGLIVINEAMGWRRVFSKNPPFPEIGKGAGKGDAYMDSISAGVGPAKIIYIQLKVDDKTAHPVTQGVGDFKALHDMPDIVPGDKGQALVKRADQGAAVVVAGTVGKGRVVLVAPALGCGERNMEEAPKGAALTLLLNCIKWVAGDK